MEKDIIPYIHRDISWLSFNYRVLQEAKDPNTPLLERIKFMAIYSSNLDEFFRVRVANHRNLVRVGKKAKRKLDFEPELILKQVLKIVSEQQEEFSDIFQNELIPELKKHGINLIKRKSFTDEQVDFLEDYFRQNLLPFVQPVLLIEDKIKPFLSNGSLYLALHMKSKIENNKKSVDKKKDDDSVYAITKMPSDQLDRFIELPPRKEGSRDFVMLDDVVRHIVRFIYPGYDILDTFSIKLTRDAELYIDDEFSGDLISKIKKSLKKRNVGPASRMVYDREIPKHFLHYLSKVFDITNFDLLPEGRYHNNSDFFKFPKINDPELYDKELIPTPIPQLENAASILDKIKERDHIVHVPYQSYESVVKFFEDASTDPDVTHIKIVQYRVSKKSRIMNALMKAARSGKKVSAFVEVKARFDEELNIEWGEKLEQAGVNVNYSMPGLKVHSKMAMVIRKKDNGEEEKYCYFSSGNFHEGTVNLYSDIGVFTYNKDISEEANSLFHYLEKKELPKKAFEHLGVGQFGIKEKIIGLINQEIKNAENGLEASMVLKMNSLQDPGMIELLYEASNKGVKIKLIVRGMCSLVSGVGGVSENIKAISIVDRFLEHTRVFIFHNNGEEKIYLSSADLMFRNLHHRVETMIPIYAGHIRKVILDMIDIQWSDNTKARLLTNKKLNEYRKLKEDSKINRSQEKLHEYFKEKTSSL